MVTVVSQIKLRFGGFFVCFLVLLAVLLGLQDLSSLLRD